MHRALVDTERAGERRGARKLELAEHPLRQTQPQAVILGTGVDGPRGVRELDPSVLADDGEVSADDDRVLGEEAELGLEHARDSVEACMRIYAPSTQKSSKNQALRGACQEVCNGTKWKK
jgi:hypothetical protein